LLLLVKDKKHLKPLLKQWQASGSVSSTLTPALSLQGRGGQQVDSEVPSPLEGEGRVRGEKTVRKTYLAIVFGKFEPGKRTVDAPIGDLPDSPIRMKLGVVEVAASSPSPLEGEGGVRGKDNAKPSITEFSLLESR